jgi:uncharacterized protein YbbK (DUF523 family)
MNAIVSACLLGINCRYDGSNSRNQKVFDFIEEKGINPIPVCPEQLAGLPTPRVECETYGDGFEVLEGHSHVYSREGEVMTDFFIKGAEEVLKIAKITNAGIALMKSKSPSCGAGTIYDGTFCGRTREGFGVTAALLRKNGIDVIEFD